MGQKVIPISLRLNKKENWNSSWIVEKNEYSKLLHFELEIKKYFNSIFNYKNIKLLKVHTIKNSKNFYVYIYVRHNYNSSNFYKLPYNKIITYLNLYYKNNNIKIFIKNIKANDLKKLKNNLGNIFRIVKKQNRINRDIKKMIYNFSYGLYTKNINIISYHIKQSLERKKIHKKIMKNVDSILQCFFNMFSNFIGYRLQFKGRLNGSKRKKKIIYQKGKIPLNTLKYNIQYNLNEFKTPSGICSIKLWIFLKKDFNQNKICYFPKKQNIKNNLKVNL
jgi:small subunit ribosomal protein S3